MKDHRHPQAKSWRDVGRPAPFTCGGTLVAGVSQGFPQFKCDISVHSILEDLSYKYQSVMQNIRPEDAVIMYSYPSM